MSRVSIDALLAEYREAPNKFTKEAQAIVSTPTTFEDGEIEKMASLLSNADLAIESESFEEKVAQALILGQSISAYDTTMEKRASRQRRL